jgi:1,4-alpha-glucan branching enzyme
MLAMLGHEVHVFTEARGRRPGRELDSGVHVHHLAASRLKPRVLFRACAVDRALRTNGPFDVVQACEWGGEAAIYSLRPTAPLVTRLATPHFLIERLNGVPLERRARQAMSRWLERLQARRSHLVISPSRALALQVARAWKLDPASIAMVSTGVARPRVSAASVLPVPDWKPYVLYFGRLEARKGVEVWLRALPRVLGACADLHAVLVGEDAGIGGRQVQDLAREWVGAEHWKRLHFVPHLSQSSLFPIIAGARLVVIPSLWENLANACLEAMALGRAVVATTGSGFEEVITHGVDGFLVPPGNVERLAAQVVDALGSQELLERVGEAAERRAADFDLAEAVKSLLAAYQRLQSVRGSPGVQAQTQSI